MEDLGLTSALAAYRGRRILVTGHTGFKGSWLALWLSEAGALVGGLALPPEEGPGHFKLAGVRERLAYHREGDVRDAAAVDRAVGEHAPEVVFHLAAQPLVSASYADPKRTFDVNVGGTVNVLEAVRRAPSVRAVVLVTSDKCYENQEWVYPYREDDALGGRDPYSASKAAAEVAASAYRRSFFASGAGVATARAGNVVGGGDWSPDRLVPDCVRALSSGGAARVRNPRSVRPWQHVLDPLGGYLSLGAALLRDPRRYGGAYNFGPGPAGEVSAGEVARLFSAAWGGPPPIHAGGSGEEVPHEAGLLRLSTERTAQVLGWRAALGAAEAVSAAACWYRRWYDSSRRDGELSELSRREIAAHVARRQA